MMHPQQGVMIETLEAHESLQKALAEAHTGPWPLQRLRTMTLLEFLCIAGPNRIRFTYEGPIDGEFHGVQGGNSPGETVHGDQSQDADVSLSKSLAALESSAVPAILPIRPVLESVRPLPAPYLGPTYPELGGDPDGFGGSDF